MKTYPFLPLKFTTYSESQMLERAKAFYEKVKQRRTVREFSPEPLPQEVIEQALLAAGTAPSGANMQPWHFVVVSDPDKKAQIRQAAEAEEKEFYQRRASQEWLDALAPLGTDEHKPFLEIAPYLIVIFAKKFSYTEQGEKRKNYYVSESVGIATGLLITALHEAGVATLTHTPSPMKFLNQLLERPDTERPYMILVAGYPDKEAKVPDISKFALSEVATFV